MTGTRRRGVRPRALALRSAANRFRWEIDLALGLWPNAHTPNLHDHLDVVSALDEIAESVAILRQVLDTVDEHLPAEHRQGVPLGDHRDRFGALLDHYRRYHSVPR